MRKLLDSLENAQKAWVDLKKDAKGAHKLFKDYQPEEDLVKREKIIYTGSVKDFVRLTLPILDDVRLAVNGRVPVHFFGKTGGDMPMYTLAEMTAEVNRLLEE